MCLIIPTFVFLSYSYVCYPCLLREAPRPHKVNTEEWLGRSAVDGYDGYWIIAQGYWMVYDMEIPMESPSRKMDDDWG